jgi:hypothetical protein
VSFITYHYFIASSGGSRAWPEISAELEGSHNAIRRLYAPPPETFALAISGKSAIHLPDGGFSLNGAAQAGNWSER